MDEDSLKQLSTEELEIVVDELSNKLSELKEENEKLQEVLYENQN